MKRRREEATTTTTMLDKMMFDEMMGKKQRRETIEEIGGRPSGSRHREACRAFRGGGSRFTLRATISA